MMQNELIKQMVERFLGWSLPENFNPDDGISFEPVANKGTVYEFKRQPTGTNLLDYTQAEAMVRYMVEGLERTSSTKEGPSEGWCITMARLEGDAEISAGAIDHPLRCPPLGAPATDSTELEARLRSSAKAFRENTVYDSEGDPLRLIVQADESDEAADAIASYRAELAQVRDKLAKANEAHWFYFGDDCSSEQCRFSIDECIDEDFEWDNRAQGDHVFQVSGARPVPDMWVALHYYTDTEKDARDTDDRYSFTVHSSEDEARQALKDTAHD